MQQLRLDPTAAGEIAAAHLEAARVGGPLARAAYARLVEESDELFQRVTETDPDPVRIVFSACPSPYDSASELISSVRQHRVLEVTTVACERDRLHPLMGCERGGAYDRFRAVHDVLGHARLRVGFDRQGEYEAWRFQERLHGRLARRALATELHGEHSVRWTTGDLPEHKAVLIDERLVRTSRLGLPLWHRRRRRTARRLARVLRARSLEYLRGLDELAGFVPGGAYVGVGQVHRHWVLPEGEISVALAGSDRVRGTP